MNKILLGYFLVRSGGVRRVDGSLYAGSAIRQYCRNNHRIDRKRPGCWIDLRPFCTKGEIDGGRNRSWPFSWISLPSLLLLECYYYVRIIIRKYRGIDRGLRHARYGAAFGNTPATR